MAIKYREAEELRATTRKNLTAAPENWMRFLKTASYTYKYSYPDQLLISAQFPNATAVASFDVWSDRFGRRIRKGEKGIGLIDNTGRYPKMRYVFDISQSDRYKDVPQPYVWDLQEEYKNELILSLAGDLSISVEEAVSDFCENTVDSLIEEYENDVVSAAKESAMLDGMDDEAVKTEFRKIVFESVKYMALVRCGLDTSSVDDDVFRNLSAFSEVQITDILGTAVSSISEQALREIETTVKTVERRNQNERNNQEQDNKRNTAPLGRGDEDILSDSERGQGGLTYTLDPETFVYLPNLTVTQDEREIGIWGERRRRYLQKAKPTLYMQMQDNHSLTDHLISINEAADSMMEQLEAEMMEKEGVNEKLKAEDWMEWVRRANSIQNRAEEIVYSNLINK